MFSAPSIGTPMPHSMHALWQRLPQSVCLTVVLLLLACLPAWGQAPTWQTPSPSALRVAEPGVALAQPPAQSEMPMAEGEGYNGPTPKTLDDFVALAERSHPRLRAARAVIEAARGKAVQARLYPNPLSFIGSPQATPKQTYVNDAGSSTQYFGGASQDIVTAGKLRLSQQAALRDVQKAEYELIRARFDVLREVRQTYYALLVAQRRLEIYQLLLDIAKRSYDIGRQLAEAGEGTKADVLFWSIERDRAE
ncbi:MAG: TolC family protein, partial [Planctomycetota bacterium]